MRKLDQATVKTDQLAKMAVQTACLLVEREAKTSMTAGKGLSHADYMGRRQYKRQKKGKGKWHSASAPGQPPAVDTGRLRASITWNIENRNKSHPYTFTEGADTTDVPATGTGFMKIIGLVGTNVSYGPLLEAGTSKMAARPWLFPALKRKQGEIAILFRQTLKKL